MCSKDKVATVNAKLEAAMSNFDYARAEYALKSLRGDIPVIIWMAENGHFDEFPGRIGYLASEGLLTLEGGGASATPTDLMVSEPSEPADIEAQLQAAQEQEKARSFIADLGYDTKDPRFWEIFYSCDFSVFDTVQKLDKDAEKRALETFQ